MTQCLATGSVRREALHMSILVRPAKRGDVPALVRLRLANAERHIQLAPGIYRVPDVEAVRRHFEEVVADGSKVLISVAEVAGEVVGMAEVVLLAEPPDHQILVPRRGADIHTVVLGRVSKSAVVGEEIPARR